MKARVFVALAIVLAVGVITGLGLSSGGDLRTGGSTSGLSDAQVGTGAISGGVTRLGGSAQAEAPSVVAANASFLGPGHGAYDAVTCMTASKCVAVGAGSDGAGVVGVTTDGAISWSAGSLPIGTPLLNSVACPDTQHCVAVGQGAILVSSDGGSTWTYQPPPSPQTTLLGVACNTSGDCIAAGVSPNPGAPYRAELARSADHGATWASVALPDSYGLGSVACPTTTLCVAVGAALMVSTDGGQAWAPRPVTGGMGALSSVSCIDALHCIAIGANPAELFDPTVPANGILTADGGQTWARITLPADSGTVQSISCSPNGTCDAGGPSGNRGGAAVLEQLGSNGSWATGTAPTGMTDLADIDCHLGSICIAVGLKGHQPLTAASSDAGRSWTPAEVPLS